jgi:hypothetical protein
MKNFLHAISIVTRILSIFFIYPLQVRTKIPIQSKSDGQNAPRALNSSYTIGEDQEHQVEVTSEVISREGEPKRIRRAPESTRLFINSD